MNKLINGQKMMADAKFYMGYSRWDSVTGQYETWKESVARVLDMHREKYASKMTPKLSSLMDFAQDAYSTKMVLGAQRALQFGGEQLFKHEARMYNCATAHVSFPKFFQEAMYLLLCGCGVGFSVQRRHLNQLPGIKARTPGAVKVFQVPDSIEGWADAFGVLLSSYFVSDAPFPEYAGATVHFDLSLIRPKGAMISGGFKAPGPDGLSTALARCEALLTKAISSGETRLRSIVAYDFVMHMSDAVLSGGVRRSATICMFDKDDIDMLNAKTGAWYLDNPQRGRSNNSVMLKRDELTREEWAGIMASVKTFGEPGFIFTDNLDAAFNPCVEIGMLPISEKGEPGFQFCNLVEINGGQCTTRDKLFEACRSASILATLQAGYTSFKYLSNATREITEREALIGVSITGWMNNPQVLFDEEILRQGADIVKQTNKEVAALLGINPAARTTCAKPSGNASIILQTASGIHGEHAPKYLRHVQMNKEDEVTKLIQLVNPKMVEAMTFGNGSSVTVAFPITAPSTSIFKADLKGVRQLEFVKKAQEFWVESGTNLELCVDPTLRHNISNTIEVDDWAEVEQYIFDNRASFAGISLLAAVGDKAYAQAPFAEVRSEMDILKDYGSASLFASGLVVDGLHAFDDLWTACAFGLDAKRLEDETTAVLLKRDWVRRLAKFADNFFEGDVLRATLCLKDVYLLHKWVGINREMQDIDFSKILSEPVYVSVDTLGSQGCAGGACEITF